MRAPCSAAVLLAWAGLAPPALAQAQFEDLGPRFTPSPRSFYGGVEFADVDGDGDGDLVSSDPTRLYLNGGDGTFVDVTSTHLPPLPFKVRSCLATGDVDGDGDVDLVLGTNDGSYTPWGMRDDLLLNDGRGVFTDVSAARMPPTTSQASDVAIGDVDGDGDLDVALANGIFCCTFNASLYLNDGSGTFSDGTGQLPPSRYIRFYAVRMLDVDADGDLDLAFATQREHLLYLNDGRGFFTDVTATHMPSSVATTYDLASGDVDGDGDLDLVLGSIAPVGTELYLNSGTGVFSDATSRLSANANRPPIGLLLSDLDGDFDLDLVAGDYYQKRLYLNDGSAHFALASQRMPSGGWYLEGSGDVDGDGDVDLVTSTSTPFSPRIEINLLRQLDAPYPAQLGTHYLLAVYARYGRATNGNLAYPLLASATANIPVPPLGTLLLDPTTMVALPPLAIPQPAGVSSLSLVVPNVPSLIGVILYSQALLIQHPVAFLTNLTADEISR